MGNIILTESQYSRIKDFIIEQGLKMDEFFKIDNKTGQATAIKDIQLLQNTFIKQGAVFKLSPNGNVTSNATVTTNGTDYKKFVAIYCDKNYKIQWGNDKTGNSYLENTSNLSARKALESVCSTLKKIKQGLSKTYGTEAVGGGMGYTQKYDQPITSQDGTKMTIPKGTGFVPKKDGAGASFKLGNDFGWFDCNTKNFVINKVKYTSDTLSKTLSAKLCKSETPAPNVVGGGGGTNTPGSKGGGSSTALPPDIDLYI